MQIPPNSTGPDLTEFLLDLQAPPNQAFNNAMSLVVLQFNVSQALATALSIKPHKRFATADKIRKEINALLDILPSDIFAMESNFNTCHDTLRDRMLNLHGLSKNSKTIHTAAAAAAEAVLVGDILCIVSNWLPDIWYLIADPNSDADKYESMALVALCECSDALSIVHSSTRGENVHHHIIINLLTIVDPDGGDQWLIPGQEQHLIYGPGDERTMKIPEIIAWMWRGLLVFVASRYRPTDRIMNDMDIRGITNNVFNLIRQPGEERNVYGHPFRDEHWTDSMKSVAATLYSKRRLDMIHQFLK